MLNLAGRIESVEHSRFSEQAPGRLVQISAPQEDWAFIPATLPRNWEPPREIISLLIDAREALARLDGVGRYIPSHALLLRPLQQREAIRSSSLEGTYATPEELLAYEMEPKEPASSADRANDWREVLNYDRALRQGQELLKGIPISSRLIRELHATLLGGVRGRDRTPGEFRQRQVHIGSDRRFIPPPADQVSNLIADLEIYIHDETGTDPLIKAFLAHYQFETIHPFLDGNGRVGRLVLSLMVFVGCRLKFPWLYLSAYFDRYKDEYINNLFRVSTHADWLSWVRFCLQATVTEANDAIRRIDQLLTLKNKYEQKIASARLSARANQIMLDLFGTPMVSAPSVARKFSVTFPTAKNDIDRLISLDILSPSTMQGSPQYYIAKEIFSAAYNERE